jgi:hypothetical protein
MVTGIVCRLPLWPMGPILGFRVLGVLIAIAGVVFSVIMLVDCLKRPASKFYRPLTKNAQYDRLIWAGAIVLSLWFYFLGAIVYLLVVKNAKPEDSE